MKIRISSGDLYPTVADRFVPLYSVVYCSRLVADLLDERSCCISMVQLFFVFVSM